MKSVFKTHFLKKLNKEDIKLLKTYGLTSVHGRKASGVEFFEKVHEIVEKEYNSEKKTKYHSHTALIIFQKIQWVK